MQDPFLVALYGIRKGLAEKPEWEWIKHYIQSSPVQGALTSILHSHKKEMNGESAPKKYKFGTEVPKNVKHALLIDQRNQKTGWQDAINLEIAQLNSYETFKVIEEDMPTPMGYKRIPHHIIFDVKFDGRLKARLVAGGHRTPDVPKEESFSTVVSMEAVRLVFILAKMNNREVCAGDVGNAYLYSKTRERVYIIAGPEFGPDLEGK